MYDEIKYLGGKNNFHMLFTAEKKLCAVGRVRPTVRRLQTPEVISQRDEHEVKKGRREAQSRPTDPIRQRLAREISVSIKKVSLEHADPLTEKVCHPLCYVLYVYAHLFILICIPSHRASTTRAGVCFFTTPQPAEMTLSTARLPGAELVPLISRVTLGNLLDLSVPHL